MKKNIYISIIILAFVAVFFCFLFYFGRNKDIGVVLAPENMIVDETSTTSLPYLLLIPKLGVEAKVEYVGVTKGGNMAIPKNPADVGWYKFGTVPGAKGNAVITGHLDNFLGRPLVFSRLDELSLGDDVYVVNEKGEKLHFQVIDKKTYDYNATSTKDVFGKGGESHLNLITCSGSWVQSVKSYNKRLVVFTELKL